MNILGEIIAGHSRYKEALRLSPDLKRSLDLLRRFDKDVEADAIDLVISRDPTILKLIHLMAAHVQEGTRAPTTVKTGAYASLNDGYTDLLSANPTVCCILNINDDSLAHLSFDIPLLESYISKLRSNSSISQFAILRALLQEQLMITFPIPDIENVRKIDVLPGKSWSQRDANQLPELLSFFFPNAKSKIAVYPPGIYSTWLGHIPEDKGRLGFYFYNWTLDKTTLRTVKNY